MKKSNYQRALDMFADHEVRGYHHVRYRDATVRGAAGRRDSLAVAQADPDTSFSFIWPGMAPFVCATYWTEEDSRIPSIDAKLEAERVLRPLRKEELVAVMDHIGLPRHRRVYGRTARKVDYIETLSVIITERWFPTYCDASTPLVRR